MNDSDRIVLSPSVALAPAEDGYLAYDIETGCLHRLNAAAAVIVELCNGQLSRGEISALIAPILGARDPKACDAWINAAHADGLLKFVDGNTPLPSPPQPKELAFTARKLRKEGSVLAAFVCQYHATQQSPDDGGQWCALGELAHIVGRRGDAREAYERYLEFEPDDAEVQQILVALRDETPPPRAPDRCIEQLYARFSEFYEDNMCGHLDYQGPKRLAEALDEELGATGGLDLLELGCGTGLAASVLRPRARRLTGIDLSREMIDRAKVRGLYDELVVAEITTWLEQSAGTMHDLIVACDTLIYFGDLRQVLRPAYARLRPGGRVVFTVEMDDKTPFRLTDSGRYAHSQEHIMAAAAEAGFILKKISKGLLRYEYGEDVIGLITVLQRPV